MGVLNPVGLDYFYFVADLNGEVHAINRIALFDLLKNSAIPTGKGGSLVKAFFNGGKEAVFLCCHNFLDLDLQEPGLSEPCNLLFFNFLFQSADLPIYIYEITDQYEQYR